LQAYIRGSVEDHFDIKKGWKEQSKKHNSFYEKVRERPNLNSMLLTTVSVSQVLKEYPILRYQHGFFYNNKGHRCKSPLSEKSQQHLKVISETHLRFHHDINIYKLCLYHSSFPRRIGLCFYPSFPRERGHPGHGNRPCSVSIRYAWYGL
jgi:hypothetical protein